MLNFMSRNSCSGNSSGFLKHACIAFFFYESYDSKLIASISSLG
jgi:hypothetical protein